MFLIYYVFINREVIVLKNPLHLKIPFSIRLAKAKIERITSLAVEGNASLWIRLAIDEKLKRDEKKA